LRNSLYTALHRTDRLVPIGLFLFSFALYIRTLAPDVLYGDSGEFQTLTYTLGHTHSTGYPVYLLLARLFGFLPIGNLAWRVNLFSALSAALTVSFVYLLGWRFTTNWIGPTLGSLLLAVSYTFWSQAIIAEVYTPGAAFSAFILTLLLNWQENPTVKTKYLFVAALLTAGGVGVHASVGLFGFAALLFVAWVVNQHRSDIPQAKKMIISAAGGTILGLAILILAFMIIDINNPKSSFINTMLEPSRSTWNLQASDLDSPYERIRLTLSGLQWQDAMFPNTINLVDEFIEFQVRFAEFEFSDGWLWISWLSLLVFVLKIRQKGVFILLNVIFLLFFILNYEPPDKYLFFLPVYILLTAIAGAGVGQFLNWLKGTLKLDKWTNILLQSVIPILLFAWIAGPEIESRTRAVETGVASFIQEDYVFPANKLSEPRAIATLYLSALPEEDAVLIMDWRALYATYFIAHVEGRNPDLQIYEAMPHGNRGAIADSLVEKLDSALGEGRPVFSNEVFPGVENNFSVKRLSGTGLYQLNRK
jgi:hypothetical protein